MLVLTRKQNEKVRIGDSITITVLRMKGKAVRLGIEAPLDVNVIRGELCFELSDEDADESAAKNCATDAGTSPRRGKPTASQDGKGHWPLPRQEKSKLAGTTSGTLSSTFPLKAMVEARSV